MSHFLELGGSTFFDHWLGGGANTFLSNSKGGEGKIGNKSVTPALGYPKFHFYLPKQFYMHFLFCTNSFKDSMNGWMGWISPNF